MVKMTKFRSALVPVDRGPTSVDEELRRQQRVLATCTGAMAVAAVAGAVGLVGGGIDFGEVDELIRDRIPWQNPVVAGLALGGAVAVPMGTAALMAWRGAAKADVAALVAGAALICWIVGEVALLRVYSWMQPACLGYGLLVAGMGWHLRRSRAPETGITVG
jgi:hypothetical protein